MSSRTVSAGLLLLALIGTPIETFAQPVGTKVEVVGHFTQVESADSEVSGIDCSNSIADPVRVCLVALDEGLSAQLVTFALRPTPKLTIYQSVPLLNEASEDDRRLKEIPQTACPAGEGKFNENDSEGVSFLAGNFVVTGSHGCGRKKHRFKASAFLDIRLAAPSIEALSEGDKALGTGAVPDWTPRLNQAFYNLPDLATAFGKDTSSGSGLSIEGIAGSGNFLFFGLRSPVLNTGTPIVAVNASDLFEGSGALTAVTHLATLRGLGIRDLALLDSNPLQLLILAGPKDGEGGPFKVFLFSPHKGGGSGATTFVDELPYVAGEKAEGVLVVARDGRNVRILVVHDGVPNGDPTLYDLTLP